MTSINADLPSPHQDEPIDLVYTWVDGSDPAFLRSLRTFAADANGVIDPSCDQRQYRNNDELRYSLRSMEKTIPWYRHLHLVTNGQVPEWLDTSHPRLRLVTHEEIFPDRSHLPTFNSNAIELNLHHIPGLSRQFIYFNDDLFVDRALTRHHFIPSPDRQVFYFEDLPLHRNPDEGWIHDRAYAHTRNLVLGNSPETDVLLLPAHCPQLYDRDFLAAIENEHADWFHFGCSNRFRKPTDVVLRILYTALRFTRDRTCIEARVMGNGTKDYRFIMLSSAVTAAIDLYRLRLGRPGLFCINEDTTLRSPNRATLRLARMTLWSLFPHPSSFEKRQHAPHTA